MKGIFVSTFFSVLLIFGLSSSISISQQTPAKTDFLGAPGTVISSTPFNLNTRQNHFQMGRQHKTGKDINHHKRKNYISPHPKPAKHLR